jgi:uncharacterized membrane protein YfcA
VDSAHLALVAAAAVVGGFVNAIAGGGSLITFPTLVACGVPPLVANVTNTVALCPGYFGATIAQRRELAGQRARLVHVLPAAIIGGGAGALLLVLTGGAVFQRLVPFLLVFAAALIAAQGRLRAWLARRSHRRHPRWAAVPIAGVAVYGGYFGAGVSVIVLAALAIVIDDSLVRLNALKQAIALANNLTAAVVFAILSDVHWLAAAVMAGGAIGGGALGGALASRVPAPILRWLVVAFALAAAAIYFVRWVDVRIAP